jgi:hypothetical protein
LGYHGPGHQFGCVLLNFGQARQLGLALDQRNYRLLVVLTDDGVGFPVAEPAFTGNGLRALSDPAAALELAAPVIAAIAFASLFLAAQVAKEGATLALVGVDVLIERSWLMGACPSKRRRHEICSGLYC